MVGIGIFISTIMELLFIVPSSIECYANLMNPTPKMSDRDEEREFSFCIIKTREMYETIKR